MEKETEVIVHKNNMKKTMIITIIILAAIVMVLLQVGYEIKYNDYEKIHNKKVSSKVPEYEVPILKVTELINRDIADGIAYDKYNMTPYEYSLKLMRLENIEQESRRDEIKYVDDLLTPYWRFGDSYKVSYEITDATRYTKEQIEELEWVEDLYVVKFNMIMSGDYEEDFEHSYEYKIAKVDGEWIFYENRFDVEVFMTDWTNANPIEW